MVASGRMDDGFSTQITFSGASTIALWEKEVTPPAIDGGGEIDTTTMINTTWRTKWHKSLKTMVNAKATCAYDPDVYTTVIAQINVNQQITISFPDGSAITFWGFLNSFTPNALQEGAQPTAEVEVICTNQNNSKVEQAPVIT